MSNVHAMKHIFKGIDVMIHDPNVSMENANMLLHYVERWVNRIDELQVKQGKAQLSMPKQKRQCKYCYNDISKKHPNAKFCNSKCKDRYHNSTNPRGLGAVKNDLCTAYNDEYVDDYDGSWESHGCVTVDQEEALSEIIDVKNRMRRSSKNRKKR